RVDHALENLKKAAENPEENLMPYILEAVKAKATLGEMTDALREVFGEYRAPQIF
ncbi:methylmalonyl-CoA mutase family protein, partial [Geoglobus sp.]